MIKSFMKVVADFLWLNIVLSSCTYLLETKTNVSEKKKNKYLTEVKDIFFDIYILLKVISVGQ